ncbi:hydroxyacylglutathione hydrolase [Rhodobacter sp. KR11]|uniref:hydroxyacylglutathione hydrolase n=1 Tax=Rhodobacter sp. KR11 TaxID=2974588 RepID=UPI002223ECB0|nr:hydroxyacylglutathione hydrolase [Rhodobacter sp. KR11]
MEKPMLDLVTIPCLKDNYAYLIRDPETGQTAVVDVPDAIPVIETLQDKGWKLGMILLTHHHDDHVQGVARLVEATGAMVLGARADSARLPRLDRALVEGDRVTVGGEEGVVLDVSGHTVGHIAFHFPASNLAFTADSLMAGGCGRLFEGSPATMWASLQKLAALPDDTLICSGHEYTASNLRFAAVVDPDNAALQARIASTARARAMAEPTVPSLLSLEKATNPFLRAPLLKAALGMAKSSDAEAFAEIRARKDKF